MLNSKFKIQNSKLEGSVLLLSLLVLSGVLITGFTIGDLLLRDFVQSRRIDEGSAAFYTAESGIEEGMHRIRKTDATLGSLSGTSGLPNGSSYERTVTDSVPAIITSLDINDYFTVDFYDPDDTSAGSGIDTLGISWEDTCGGCSWLEVGYTEWVPASGIDWTENFVTRRYPRASSPVTIGGLDGSKAYRLRVTSHYGDMRNLNLSAYTGSPPNLSPVPIRHAIVTMTSTGIFGKTSQTMSATFTRQAPLQKIFDFVTFSECSIVKDGGAPVCP